jgi:hypothetical protein
MTAIVSLCTIDERLNVRTFNVRTLGTRRAVRHGMALGITTLNVRTCNVLTDAASGAGRGEKAKRGRGEQSHSPLPLFSFSPFLPFPFSPLHDRGVA